MSTDNLKARLKPGTKLRLTARSGQPGLNEPRIVQRIDRRGIHMNAPNLRREMLVPWGKATETADGFRLDYSAGTYLEFAWVLTQGSLL